MDTVVKYIGKLLCRSLFTGSLFTGSLPKKNLSGQKKSKVYLFKYLKSYSRRLAIKGLIAAGLLSLSSALLVSQAETPPSAQPSGYLGNNITIYQPEKADNGYTLLSSFGTHENPPGSRNFFGAILIDMRGNIVNEWPIMGYPAKMLPGGHVMGYRFLVLDAKPRGLDFDPLQVYDWYGNLIWQWNDWDTDFLGRPITRGHHDYQREGNPVGYYAPGQDALPTSGKTLMLVHENVERPDISTYPLENDVIVEINYQGNIIWQWNPIDHVEEFGFDEAAREAMQTSQVPGGAPGTTDWLHTNNVNYLGPNKWWDAGDVRFHPDNLIVDSRTTNIIWIIDKASGNIVWKVGPDYSVGNPEAKLGQIIGQHHAHIIPRGLPGAGNVLLFDNGGFSGFGEVEVGEPRFPNQLRSYSRVLEFNPITLDVVWEYSKPLPDEEGKRFFSWYISSAQRLSNGNTLITEGETGRIFEVTPAKEIVWEYISPFDDITEIVDLPVGNENEVYRAYRVPYDYIPAELIEATTK